MNREDVKVGAIVRRNNKYSLFHNQVGKIYKVKNTTINTTICGLSFFIKWDDNFYNTILNIGWTICSDFDLISAGDDVVCKKILK